MPIWVFLGLMNIETRKGALILVWASLAITIVCVPISIYMEDWSWVVMMAVMTLWYFLSMRWVDRNMDWG